MPITQTPILVQTNMYTGRLSVQVLLPSKQHTKMSVAYLKTLNFSRLSLEEKLAIKTAGRPTPEIYLFTKGHSHGREYTRIFLISEIYGKESCGRGGYGPKYSSSKMPRPSAKIHQTSLSVSKPLYP